MVKLMLDAGHGLNTPGKRSLDGSLHEWSFNSVVAKYVADLLAQYEDVTTFFAHDVTGTMDVPLQTRTDKANQLGVDAYISFHANAGSPSARGLETYVYPNCPSSTVALGNAIHKSLIATTGMKDRGLKRADFHVLRETKMDAVLIEHGFMTNDQDLLLLKSDDFRHTCSQGTVNALAGFYGLKKKEVTKQVYFYTGGYTGEALAKIHGFLLTNKWWYQPSCAADGTMMFLIGAFSEGSNGAVKMENFLKENKWWYEKR